MPLIKNSGISSFLTSLLNTGNQNNFIKQPLKITIKNMLINNNNKKKIPRLFYGNTTVEKNYSMVQ